MKTILSFLFFLFIFNIFSQDTINDYYEEITSGSEMGDYSKTKFKFYKDVKIYVYGEKNDTLISELNKIVDELNDLIETVNVSIISDSTKANIKIYFGSAEYFCSKRNEKLVHDLSKYAQGFVLTYPCNGVLNGSSVFVNTEVIDNMKRKKHVLREELTQAFGFCHDSYKYPTSIFYELFSDVTSYSEIDKAIIVKHYKQEN
jgi:hypothetical protein